MATQEVTLEEPDNDTEETGLAVVEMVAGTLSLSQLQAELARQGVHIALSGLSELLNEGQGENQIAMQLGVTRLRNKLVIPRIALDTLVGWWPIFQEQAGGRKPKAPALLASYLARLRQPIYENLPGTGLVTAGSFGLSQTPKVGDAPETVALLQRIAAAVEGQHVEDRALTKAEAARIMGLAESSVNKHVPSLTPGFVSYVHVQNWLKTRREAAEERRAKRAGKSA